MEQHRREEEDAEALCLANTRNQSIIHMEVPKIDGDGVGGGRCWSGGVDPTAKPRTTDTKTANVLLQDNKQYASRVRNGALGTLVQPVTHTAVSCGPPSRVDGKEPQGITGTKSRLNFPSITLISSTTYPAQPDSPALEKALHVGSQEETQHTALPLLPALNLSFLAIHSYSCRGQFWKQNSIQGMRNRLRSSSGGRGAEGQGGKW